MPQATISHGPASLPACSLGLSGTGVLTRSLLYEDYNNFVINKNLESPIQVIVQRTLASKNISHAKGGVLLAGTLKFLPLFLLVIPGMAARVLYKNEVGYFDIINTINIIRWAAPTLTSASRSASRRAVAQTSPSSSSSSTSCRLDFEG